MAKKINTVTKLGIALVLAVWLTSGALAWGIGAPSGATYLYPGETKTISLILQNLAGEGGDLTVKAELVKGSEIASTPEKNYLVKFGTADTKVPVKITIPEDASIGTSYSILVSFATLSTGEGGGVSFGTAMTSGFDIAVSQKPEGAETPGLSKNLIWILVAILAVIAIIIIIVIIKKRKR